MAGTKFDTGKPGQVDTIVWARKRLIDRAGRKFVSEDGSLAQDGVMLADPVGMGKTWEALGAAVLCLQSNGRRNAGSKVLVICPPGLVTKWEDELSSSGGFIDHLRRWAEKRETPVTRAIERVFGSVVPIRSVRHVRMRRHRGKVNLRPGVYIASYGLFSQKGHGIAALIRERWDVIIVDEAHNKRARDALKRIEEGRRRQHRKLLLSATPFQLEPRQLNQLTRFILKNQRTEVMHRPQVVRFLNAVEQVFANPGTEPPARGVRIDAERCLNQLISRNRPRKSQREYSIIDPDGRESAMFGRLDRYVDASLREQLSKLGPTLGAISSESKAFEQRYLEFRHKLALNGNPTYVATRIRRYLAGGESPRLSGLQRWAERTLEADLRVTLEDGEPQKLLAFSSWVGERRIGEAEMLREALASAFDRAMQKNKARLGSENWRRWQAVGVARLAKMAKYFTSSERGPAITADALLDDELACVMAGRHQKFVSALKNELQHACSDYIAARDAFEAQDDRRSLVARGAQRRMNDAKHVMELRSERRMRTIERYTGHENRKTRDLCALGFRSVGPPWVLVASNVGAEGIDLQTYTRRIVHYDLEWNPAKMEQREGRGDRLGRELDGPLFVHFCIVPRTYDERMFHQLVARDRWHGVLLGKSAAKMARDKGKMEVPLAHIKKLERCTLDLSPG